MKSTVKVSSSLSDSFDPDIIRINVYLESEGSSKQEAILLYNKAHSALLKAVNIMGIKQKDVKNNHLFISPVMEDEEPTGRYEYNASLAFSIPCSEDNLKTAWKALSSLGDEASFSFDYDLSDYEKSKETLVKSTIEAGRKRAKVLAQATECMLGKILHIENDITGRASDDDWYFHEDSMNDELGGREEPVFNPTPVTVTCTVDLEYELIARK